VFSLPAVPLAGCSHASVETTRVYQGTTLAKPMAVLVRDFTVQPTDVTLDSGRIARLRRVMSGSNDVQKQTVAAQSVIDALSNGLVEEIDKMGLTARRVAANDDVSATAATVLIDGNIVSINEGNRAKRVVIGFGAGASDVETSVVLSYVAPQAITRQLARFQAKGSSGYAPGMLPTAGVGTAVGAASTVAVSGGTQAIRETQGATVSHNADDISGKIADQLRAIFAEQGWVTTN
jgi:hypothetical protein